MQIDRRNFLASSTILAMMNAGGAGLDSAQAQLPGSKVKISRRYVRVNERDLFYLHAGSGPPVILLHSSPGDSAFFLRDIPVLASKYSVFAFDTPGFGRSDPLPEKERDVSSLADNIAAAMRALGLPPAALFGSHTGAAIAAELAARQPDVVRSVMLDGFPIFNEQELGTWFDGFFPPLIPDLQGGQFAPIWTRGRDQSIWFPWSYKHPKHLLGQAVAKRDRIHTTMMSVMRCGRTYVPAFRSAVFYGPRAAAALARIEQPVMIAAAQGDPLSAHLDRLPPLKASQKALKLPTGDAVRALRDEWLAQHAGQKAAPAPSYVPPSDAGVRARIIALADGREIFLREAGKDDAPPLFLVHDAPGSSHMHLALILALSVHYHVIAPDLPGCGESAPLSTVTPDIADFSGVVRAAAEAMGLDSFQLHGIGFGSHVALHLARTAPQMVQSTILQSMPMPDSSEVADMLEHMAPPITLKADGSHWYATWQMLRDSLIFWPWYRSDNPQNLRRIDLARDFDADSLHDRTVEIMKQYAAYHHIIHAALKQDPRPLLNECRRRIILATTVQHPFAIYDAALRQACPQAPLVELTGDVQAHARQLQQLLHAQENAR